VISVPLSKGEKWIHFLRQYGRVQRNDTMYDEHIRRSGQRAGIPGIVQQGTAAQASLFDNIFGGNLSEPDFGDDKEERVGCAICSL